MNYIFVAYYLCPLIFIPYILCFTLKDDFDVLGDTQFVKLRHRRQATSENGTSSSTIPEPQSTDHKYYITQVYKSPVLMNALWEDLSEDYIVSSLSDAYRTAKRVQLPFNYSFYGNHVESVVIVTGGFLYTSEFMHQYLTATNYIAPLMANFDTVIGGTESLIMYKTFDLKFVVEWKDVFLKQQDEAQEPFHFQCIVHQNGTIVFLYKKIPIPVPEISSVDHPVKIGLSDAFFIDTNVSGTVRRTIYEYHRVEVEKNVIQDGAVVILTPLTTCNMAQECETCLTMTTDFLCMWCPAVERCSDGVDRYREEWLDNICPTTAVSDTCPASTTTSAFTTERPTDVRHGNETTLSTEPGFTTPTPVDVTNATSSSTVKLITGISTSALNTTTMHSINITSTTAGPQSTESGDSNRYYTSGIHKSSVFLNSLWEDLSEDNIISSLSDAYRISVKYQLPFNYTFYGHDVDSVVIGTGGFLYTNEFLHQYLTATNYIAPLMANFDTVIGGTRSRIMYKTFDSKFAVEWKDVFLQEQDETQEPFHFQSILHQNGTIVFLYKKVPMPVSEISTVEHPVKVGLSDAYFIDTNISGTIRRTIYEYDRVEIEPNMIQDETVVILDPRKTCDMAKECETCLTMTIDSVCMWCSAVQRCSDNLNWHREEWLGKNKCYTTAVSDTCPDSTTTSTTTTRRSTDAWYGNKTTLSQQSGSKTTPTDSVDVTSAISPSTVGLTTGISTSTLNTTAVPSDNVTTSSHSKETTATHISSTSSTKAILSSTKHSTTVTETPTPTQIAFTSVDDSTFPQSSKSTMVHSTSTYKTVTNTPSKVNLSTISSLPTSSPTTVPPSTLRLTSYSPVSKGHKTKSRSINSVVLTVIFILVCY